MSNSDDFGYESDSASVWRTLAADRIVRAALALLAVAFVVDRWLAAEGGSQWASRRLIPLLFQSLVLLALRYELRRIRPHSERVFWNDLSLAFGCLWASTFLFLFFPPGGTTPLAVFVADDLLHTVSFIGLLLAVELQPHRQHRWRPIRLERRLAWPTVVLGVSGFFLYFLVLPLAVDQEDYRRGFTSFAFFVTLDVYLAIRLVFLTRAAAHKPLWRGVYALLLVTLSLILVEDALETAYRFPRDGTSHDSFAGAWVNLPWITLILACRWRHHPFHAAPPTTAEKIRLEENLPGPLGQTMVFLLVLPLVHFATHGFDLLSPAVRPHREILLAAWILVLAFYGVGQYRALAESLVRLRKERSRSERVLFQMEQDLRLQAQRQQTSAAQRASDERFSKAFRACPDVMTVSRLADGRFIDVNPSCQRMFGWTPEEWIGRTSTELGVWAHPEDRDTVVRALEAAGSVHDFESDYRRKDGSLRRGVFSASVLEIDGEPHLFSVTHDVTRSRDREEELQRRLAWLERVRSAAGAFDADGRVVYWNASAERLWGLAADEALGQPAADFAARGMLPLALAGGVEPPFSWSGKLRNRAGREIAVDSCSVPIRTLGSADDEPQPAGFLVLARRRDNGEDPQ